MRTMLILAAAGALSATPAFAGNGHTPQTFSNGPGSSGSIQQKDLDQSQTQSDRNARPPGNAPAVPGNAKTPQRDPLDPQMNPHNVRNPHHG